MKKLFTNQGLSEAKLALLSDKEGKTFSGGALEGLFEFLKNVSPLKSPRFHLNEYTGAPAPYEVRENPYHARPPYAPSVSACAYYIRYTDPSTHLDTIRYFYPGEKNPKCNAGAFHAEEVSTAGLPTKAGECLKILEGTIEKELDGRETVTFQRYLYYKPYPGG